MWGHPGQPASGVGPQDRGEQRSDHRLRLCGPGFGSSGQELPRGRQLFSLFVAEAQYGTGAGQALLDATAGGSPALLWVVKENPQAVAFYGRNGFEFDGAEQADAGAPGILDARMVR